MKDIIICDIDGTVADLSHRLHYIRPETEPVGLERYKKSGKDWQAFHANVHKDKPHEDVREILWSLLRPDHLDFRSLIYVSGRMESSREATMAWLHKHGFPPGDRALGVLHMRRNDDFRDDSVVKSEIIDTLGITPDRVLCVLDDRDRVVNMWRSRGFRCLQVAPGDF